MDARAKKTIKKLSDFGQKVVKDIHNDVDPMVMIPSRSLSNVHFDEKYKPTKKD